jgi:hypothetical protein
MRIRSLPDIVHQERPKKLTAGLCQKYGTISI